MEPDAAWMLYVDGSMTNKGSGAGLIVVSPKGHKYDHALKFLFKASNNDVEYKAVLVGMELCHALGVECLRAFSDSQLVVNLVKDDYEARDVTMVANLLKVKEKSHIFKNFEIEHTPRSENRQSDAFSKLASSSPNGHPKEHSTGNLTSTNN